MSEYAKLVVSVDSRQVRTADGDLDRLGRTVGRTESSTNQLTGAFRRLAGPLAAVISAREIAQAAENYTTLTNRLRLVTEGSEELVAAQDAVFKIAQESRQPLAATAELYQRIAANSQELGLSANEIVSVVDTVNKTLAISGSSAAAASGALVQLGQAFASGQLRGEELNAVLEAAPPLAKAIADGLGVTVGELRKLGADGQLTADAVAQAIIKSGDAIDQSFGNIQTTGGQALTVLGNSLTKVIGEIDSATGSSALFADTVTGLASYLDSGELTDGLIETFNIWSASIDAIGNDIASLELEFDGLQENGSSVASFLADAFQQMPANLRAGVQIATVEVASLFDKAVAYAQYAGSAIKAAFTDATEAQAAQELEQTLVRINDVRGTSLDTILSERDAILQAAEANRQRAAEERKQRDADRAARQAQIAELRKGLQGRDISLGGAGGADKAAKEAQRNAERLQQLYQSTEQGLARQVALFGQTTEAARVRYEVENGELAKLNGAQQERLIGLAEEIDKLNQIKKNREEAAATEQYVAALRDQISARQNAIDIEIEAIGVGERQAERLRELSELEFEYVRRLEELARAQGTSAALSAEAYQARVDALREAMAEEVRIIEEGEKKKDEARKDGMSGVTGALEDYIEEANDMAKQTRDLTKSALNETEDAFVEFAKTGKLSFKDLANSIVDDLIRIGARQVTASLATGLLGALGGAGGAGVGAGAGGGGAGLAGLLSSFVGLFDAGGRIPAGGWGIVGERGPEIVRGPANVTGRQETAQMMGAPSVTIQQMNFPGITNAQEARQATATAARQIAQAVQGSARYM